MDALRDPELVLDDFDLANPNFTVSTDRLDLVGDQNDPFEDYAISMVCTNELGETQVTSDFNLKLVKPCPLAL